MLYRLTWTDENGNEQSFGDVPRMFADEYKIKIIKDSNNRNVKLFEVDATGKQIIKEAKENKGGSAFVIVGTIIFAFVACVDFVTALYLLGGTFIIWAISYIFSVFRR